MSSIYNTGSLVLIFANKESENSLDLQEFIIIPVLTHRITLQRTG